MKWKKNFPAFLIILTSTHLLAAEGEYAVNKIDTVLLKNANAVKRF